MEEEYPNSYNAVVEKLPKVDEYVKESTQNYLNEMWNSQLEKPPQNQAEGTQTITPQQGYVTEQKKAPTDIVASLFSSPPAPKYDQARQDRIQQIGKVNALGEGLKVLGDIFSVNRGANVIARQPNQDVRQAYAAWQGYEDMYNSRMDEYNRQLFQQRLQQMYRQQDMDWRHYQQEKEDEYRRQQQQNWQQSFDMSNEQFRQNTELKKEDDKRQDERFKQSIKQQAIANGVAAGHLANETKRVNAYEETQKAKALGKVTEDKNMIILSGATIGQSIKVDKRYRDKILALIVNDKLMTTDDLDLMKPRFGQPVTIAQKDYLIAKYWQQSPAVQGWLASEEAGASSASIGTPTNPYFEQEERPEYQGPYRQKEWEPPTRKEGKKAEPATQKTNWDSYEVN